MYRLQLRELSHVLLYRLQLRELSCVLLYGLQLRELSHVLLYGLQLRELSHVLLYGLQLKKLFHVLLYRLQIKELSNVLLYRLLKCSHKFSQDPRNKTYLAQITPLNCSCTHYTVFNMMFMYIKLLTYNLFKTDMKLWEGLRLRGRWEKSNNIYIIYTMLQLHLQYLTSHTFQTKRQVIPFSSTLTPCTLHSVALPLWLKFDVHPFAKDLHDEETGFAQYLWKLISWVHRAQTVMHRSNSHKNEILSDD